MLLRGAALRRGERMRVGLAVYDECVRAIARYMSMQIEHVAVVPCLQTKNCLVVV